MTGESRARHARADIRSAAEPPDEPELVLDCRGMRCPLPVIELARRIGEVPVGATAAVAADDPAAATDIPAWCRMRGQEYVGAQAGLDAVTRYVVRRLV